MTKKVDKRICVKNEGSLNFIWKTAHKYYERDNPLKKLYTYRQLCLDGNIKRFQTSVQFHGS